MCFIPRQAQVKIEGVPAVVKLARGVHQADWRCALAMRLSRNGYYSHLSLYCHTLIHYK